MILPVNDYRKTHIKTPKKLYKGLDAVVYGLAGKFKLKKKYLRYLTCTAERISENSHKLSKVSDRRIRQSLKEISNSYRRYGTKTDDILPEALSLMSEAMERTLGLRPYVVQLIGAMALHKGYLTEMATGEGKSLTACLPAVLAGWTGKPCHIITVNDYLADRDASEMRKFYSYCGISVGCVTSEMDMETRQRSYNNRVVYTTGKEILADFLRDRLKLGAYHNPSRRLIRTLQGVRTRAENSLVLRGLDTAIVDEADSVLIDEAVTPLIISSSYENEEFADVIRKAHKIGESFREETDYTVDLKYHEVKLTDEGYEKLKKTARDLTGIWKGESRREELVKQALMARVFYHNNEQYIIDDGKISIVDEFTGRLMPGRSWSYGLHQAIEAKEGLGFTNPSQTLARLSFQRFFRLFKKLSGMTGTAKEAASEVWQIYGLEVLRIPTNRPCIRKEEPDYVFSNQKNKWKAIIDEIVRINITERPILVGTRSVDASEKLALMLEEKKLEFNILNAVRHKEEAKIVSEAGEKGRITIATNMAGRGTDIKLGRGVYEIGGLHVIATERHKSGRIDRQLFGRCARQGDPGSVHAFISADDELLCRFIPEVVRKKLANAVEADRAGIKQVVQKSIDYAQLVSERFAFRQRRNVLSTDTWIEDALSFTGTDIRF